MKLVTSLIETSPGYTEGWMYREMEWIKMVLVNVIPLGSREGSPMWRDEKTDGQEMTEM